MKRLMGATLAKYKYDVKDAVRTFGCSGSVVLSDHPSPVLRSTDASTRSGGLRRVRRRTLGRPAPHGVPDGRRAPARPGPVAGGVREDLRRVADVAGPGQGGGL